MNEKNELALFILLMFCMLTVLIFIIAGYITTARNLDAFMRQQEMVNQVSAEQDAMQNKEIRLLMQDAEINRNILTSKEFLMEDKE